MPWKRLKTHTSNSDSSDKPFSRIIHRGMLFSIGIGGCEQFAVDELEASFRRGSVGNCLWLSYRAYGGKQKKIGFRTKNAWALGKIEKNIRSQTPGGVPFLLHYTQVIRPGLRKVPPLRADTPWACSPQNLTRWLFNRVFHIEFSEYSEVSIS